MAAFKSLGSLLERNSLPNVHQLLDGDLPLWLQVIQRFIMPVYPALLSWRDKEVRPLSELEAIFNEVDALLPSAAKIVVLDSRIVHALPAADLMKLVRFFVYFCEVSTVL